MNWKYILGEILLIFLGISLAMAFQNWNQQRLLKAESEDALKVIKNDLERVINEFETMLQSEDNHNEILFHYSSLKGLDSMSRHSNFDSLTFDALWAYGNINPSFPAYEALMTSGKIEIIQNEEFRFALSELDAQFKSLINSVQERQTAQLMHVDPVLIKFFDVPRLKNAHQTQHRTAETIPQSVDDLAVLKSDIVQNALSYKLALGQGVRDEIADFISVCHKIMKIEEE